MDGPHLARVSVNMPATRMLKRLIQMEESYYQKLTVPDLLIVLRLNPETAVKRKPSEKAESVRARSTEIWEKDWEQTSAHVIDASQSKEEVLQQVKELLWSHL